MLISTSENYIHKVDELLLPHVVCSRPGRMQCLTLTVTLTMSGLREVYPVPYL